MERDAFVQAALSVVNLGANPKHLDMKQAYIDLVAPEEPEGKVNDMLKMSGCGLTVAGIWRMAGVKHYKLNPPYVVGTGVSRLVTLANKVGAWIPFKRDALPDLGDMVLVGDNGDGGIEHVFTIVATGPTCADFESVDGGQRDEEGFQIIRHKRRIWKGQKDVAYVGSDPGSNLLGGRRIIGWADCTKLPSE